MKKCGQNQHQAGIDKKCQSNFHSSSLTVNYFGFTLSEVLITLTIIGVVAAITLPTLLKNYQKDQTITQLKSVYTDLNNALYQAKVDNGTDLNTWYVPNDSEAVASTYFAKTYLLPYLKTIKICGTSGSSDCTLHDAFLSDPTNNYTISGNSNYYSFVLANGAVIGVDVSPTGTSVATCREFIWMDINGKKPPNIIGKDTFRVELGGNNSGVGDRNKFLPYSWNGTRAYLLSATPDFACNKTNTPIAHNGTGCFAVIIKDGWRIADDYPW